MIIRIDATLALPVYEQIRQQVIRMVVAGTLPPGTRLPTIRQLANDLRLAKGTVSKAYTLLEEAAILETRGHRGTFIVEQAPRTVDADTLPGAVLTEAADAFTIAARQLGVDVEDAVAEVRRRWDRL